MTYPKSVYVANKMRGIELFNFPWFDRARDYLRSLGVHVISPADEDRAEGFNEYTDPFEAEELEDAVRRDVEAIIQTDAVALGPLWEASAGARAERAIAEWLGHPVWYVDPDASVPYFVPEGAAEGF